MTLPLPPDAMWPKVDDEPRRKRAARRGGHARQFAVDEADRAVVPGPDTPHDIDEAPDRPAAEDAGAADVARFRLFAGPSIAEAAEAPGISRATAFRERADARSWLTAAPDGTAGPPILEVASRARGRLLADGQGDLGAVHQVGDQVAGLVLGQGVEQAFGHE